MLPASLSCQLHWIATGGIVRATAYVEACLVPVPDTAPPYDCDIHGTTCQTPEPAGGGPVAADAAVPVVGAAGVVGTAAGVAGVAAGVAGVAAAPSLVSSCAGPAWPTQFAQAIVETLAGTRPIRQIIPWATERAQAHIRGLCPTFRTDNRPRIQRVLSSSPSATVVEATVIASFGPRTRALAMRFEHIPARQPALGVAARPARWLCTDIETG
jgi:hypothetical protein